MPGHTDFVIAHSTVAGFYSWRNTVQGSWYMQALTRVFAKERQERDLLSMLTNVNKVRETHTYIGIMTEILDILKVIFDLCDFIVITIS